MAELDILFVCIGNSCRSPMAEAIANTIGGGRVVARSAGISPLGWIAPPTLEVLEELGYPTDGLCSEGMDSHLGADFDVVVSLIGTDAPGAAGVGRGAERLTWSIPDPFGEDRTTYLGVARLLEQRIRALIDKELGGELSLL
jgi:arsenate reductase